MVNQLVLRKKNLKVILHDFSGRAKGFEFMISFCYNNSRIDITPSNISLLHSGAQFMEMNKSVSEKHNLLELLIFVHIQHLLNGSIKKKNIYLMGDPKAYLLISECGSELKWGYVTVNLIRDQG